MQIIVNLVILQPSGRIPSVRSVIRHCGHILGS